MTQSAPPNPLPPPTPEEDLIPEYEYTPGDRVLIPHKGLITTGRFSSDGADPLVDHPAHYNQHPAGIECIDVIAPMGFCVGTAIKHLWRAGLKPSTDDVQDVEKAIWYLQYHLEQLKYPLVRVTDSTLDTGSE